LVLSFLLADASRLAAFLRAPRFGAAFVLSSLIGDKLPKTAREFNQAKKLCFLPIYRCQSPIAGVARPTNEVTTIHITERPFSRWNRCNPLPAHSTSR
jgi:hypothetical protein